MNIERIPTEIFALFLEEKFRSCCEQAKKISAEILKITGSHPFYTQQLAFTVWELLSHSGFSPKTIENAANEIVQSHDNDYERLWNGINRTDMMVLTGIASVNISPLSDEFSKIYGTGASSTVFSSLKRLAGKGLLLKEKGVYCIDDPFFKKWILYRREL